METTTANNTIGTVNTSVTSVQNNESGHMPESGMENISTDGNISAGSNTSNGGTITKDGTSGEQKHPSEIIIFLRDICIILGIVLLLRTYIASPFKINGSSMESSYHNDELIIVDKISYNLGTWGLTSAAPLRGDVVVIQPHSINGKDFFIKRIIGIPGDRIKIEDGFVYVKPRDTQRYIKLSESYLNEENLGKTYPGRSSLKTDFIVPENEYFILGDNRNGSSDSRDCFYTCAVEGSSYFIKRKDIVGRLWVTLGALKSMQQESTDMLQGIDEQNTTISSKIFSIQPRFLDTPSTWNYSELNK